MKAISKLSGMPHIRSAFAGWMQKVTLVVISQTVIDGFIKDTEATICFRGTIQPLSKEAIALKPEGERSWQWLQIHSIDRCLNLKTNDKIRYNGVKYKVMNIWDYSLNGFIEYDVVRDYE